MTQTLYAHTSKRKKNYINLKNFSLKLVIIFPEDGKIVSSVCLLCLWSGQMVLDAWWLYHGGSISCEHVVS
jgi:hypothetical protein